MSKIVDDNPEYWNEYNNLQHVKHSILKRYLGGWFPVLTSWRGRVLYIDCHAGRGFHSPGQKGSPVVALDTLLTHRRRSEILERAEVNFFFIEADLNNKQALEEHLKQSSLPSNVNVEVICEQFESVIQGLIDDTKETSSQLAPAFVFVDPYGFKLPMSLLSQLKAFDRCELFINFMWRYVDMAIANSSQEDNMDALFGTTEWRGLRECADSEERCENAIKLFQRELGAEYVTWIKMLGENRATKYVLIHATNHQRGRELMKEAIWGVAPGGGFQARINDNPNQEFLISPEPDLSPLELWLWRKYKGHQVRCVEIEDDLKSTMYLPKHLHQVIRSFRKSGKVTCSKYGKHFSFAGNPLIDFGIKTEDLDSTF